MDAIMEMFKPSIESMLETASLIAKEYISDEMAEKVLKLKPHVFYHFMAGWQEPFGNFTTIIHGDSWANNAMFK